jgi:hypothetical protein
MDLKQLVMLGLQVSIVCTVFGYGLKTTTAALLDVLGRPALLLRSVICVLAIVPALAFTLTRFFEIKHEVEVVLVALAISPVPPLLPLKEMKAGGRISYGLGLLALLALLSVVTIPLAIEVLERLFTRPLAVAPFAVARLALITVLLPLVAGGGGHRSFGWRLAVRLGSHWTRCRCRHHRFHCRQPRSGTSAGRPGARDFGGPGDVVCLPASGNCLRDCLGELSQPALRRSHCSLPALEPPHRRSLCQVEQVAHRRGYSVTFNRWGRR